jgi:hypothetical protein
MPKKSQPLGMTKGRATLPWRTVARLKAFFIIFGWAPRPMIPSVPRHAGTGGMTKERAALPLRAVAEQKPFFIPLVTGLSVSLKTEFLPLPVSG